MLLAACCAGSCLIGASQVPASTYEDSYYAADSAFAIGSRVAFACVALASAFLLVKVVRMGMFTDEDGLTVRNLWRTHRVAWDAIAGIERPARYGTFRNTGIKIGLTDGSTVYASLYSAGPLNRPGFADETIAELERLRAVYTASTSAPPGRALGADGSPVPFIAAAPGEVGAEPAALTDGPAAGRTGSEPVRRAGPTVRRGTNQRELRSTSDWDSRVRAVRWSDWETASGRADAVEEQLIALRSELPKALAATHELWAGLCHQHAYLSSAALPALPFLLEVLDQAPETLTIELLDILVGFAELTAPGVASGPPSWAVELRVHLEAAHRTFDALALHPNSEISDLAGRAVAALAAGGPEMQ